MSRYDLVINGNAYTVNVRQVSQAGAQVEVNGVAYQVDFAAGTGSSPAPSAPAAPVVPASAQAAPTRAVPAAKPVVAAAPAPVAALGGEAVPAPMPGHILRVAVKVGDPVAVGDVVVIMEAMKMENEIKAHIAGVVKEVRVNAGQDVGVNDVLVVIGE